MNYEIYFEKRKRVDCFSDYWNHHQPRISLSRLPTRPMAKASIGFATPIRHLTHLPATLTSSRTSHLSTLRATVTAAAAMRESLINHHHSLEVIGGAVDTFLPAFKNLNLPYVPFPFIAWNRHVETIFAAFFRSLPDVRFRRECLRTSDDGSVALDWVSGDDRDLSSDSPVLILLVGLKIFILCIQRIYRV